MMVRDMARTTLRKDALERSERRLRLILQAARIGTWEWDLATDHITWSEGIEGLFGLSKGLLPRKLDDFYRLVGIEDIGHVKGSIDRAICRHEPYEVDFRIQWPDGTTHWLAGHGEVLHDSEGLTGMAGTVADVTPRKVAEITLRTKQEELRRSEAYLAEGQRLSHTGSWAWNVSSGELFWSSEHFRILGLDPETAKTSYPAALQWIHLKDRAVVQQAFEKAIQERNGFEQECRIVRPDGTIRHIHSLGRPVFNNSGDLTEYVGTIIDITERKNAERILRESEEKFSVIHARAPFAIVLARFPEGVIVDVNPAWIKMTGFSKEEAVGKTSLQLGIHRDPEGGAGLFAELEEGSMVRDVEAIWFTKSGDARVISVNMEVVALDGEKYLLSTMHDVTDRRRAEEQLVRANARITEILGSITDGFSVFDQNWRYIYVNESATQMLGKPAYQLLGFCVWDLFPQAVGTFAYRKCLEAMTQRISLHFEAFFPEINKWYEHHTYPMTDGLAIDWRDITARKRAEFERHRSETYLAEAQRLCHTGSGSWNVSTGEVLWSPETYRIFGVDPAKMTPSADLFFHIVHPDDRAFVQKSFQRIVREKCDYEVEFRILRSDETMRYIHSVGRPVFDESGGVIELIGTVMDITDRRLTEAQVRELSGRLLKLQDEERRRLARQLHDSTGSALTALSLRLGVVQGGANMLGSEAKCALAEGHNLLGEVSREIRSLSYLLHPPFLDESGLRSAVSWYLDGFYRRSGIKVQAQFPPTLPRLSTEIETTLFRIIQECLTNILKHSGSPTAALRIVLTERDVKLEVKDEGMGFSAGILDTPHSVVLGVGVGIMGMRERVRQLHGRLDIDSGKWGTSVTATLPVASAGIERE